MASAPGHPLGPSHHPIDSTPPGHSPKPPQQGKHGGPVSRPGAGQVFHGTPIVGHPGTPNPPKPPPVLSQPQQNIYDLMAQTLSSWGLSTLLPDLKNLIIKGDTAPDTLSLALSQTDSYKKRFAGNELRKRQGLPELNPAEYIATEEQYSNVMKAYGLPKGFYDSHDDFTKFIGNDVSPTELDTRAKIAHDQYLAAPPETKALWQQYGFTKGDAIAGILDPHTATAVIQDRASQVALGGVAAASGFKVNQARASQFNQAGVSIDQARAAYQRIAQVSQGDQSIASRFGQQFTQADEENDLLLNKADASIKRQDLYNSETALFRGGPGASANSISVDQSF